MRLTAHEFFQKGSHCRPSASLTAGIHPLGYLYQGNEREAERKSKDGLQGEGRDDTNQEQANRGR